MHRPTESQLSQVLTETQQEEFLHRSFVKLENAFPEAVAEEACAILWRESGCDPVKPATWLRPVVRSGTGDSLGFARAMSTIETFRSQKKQPQMNADRRR